MSILDKPRANPGVARILCRLVASSAQPVERESALRSIAPPGAGDYDGKKDHGVVETLDALVDLELLAIADGRLTVGPGWEADDEAQPMDVPAFRRLVRRRLFAVKPGQLLTKGGGGGRDLLRALGWFASQDPLRPFAPWGSRAAARLGALDPETTHDEQLGHANRFIAGETQWNAFHRWATFLGLASRYAIPPGQGNPVTLVTPDLTTAVADVLPDMTGELPVEAFLRGLAHELPVVDGGWVRQKADGCRRDDVAKSVSPSLSAALLRLQATDRLTLLNPNDALPSERLVLRLGHRVETIARVRVNG